MNSVMTVGDWFERYVGFTHGFEVTRLDKEKILYPDGKMGYPIEHWGFNSLPEDYYDKEVVHFCVTSSYIIKFWIK